MSGDGDAGQQGGRQPDKEGRGKREKRAMEKRQSDGRETRKRGKGTQSETETTTVAMTTCKPAEEGCSGQAELSSGRDVERQLLSMSARQWRRMLVRPDSEQAWFEQSATAEPAFPVTDKVLSHLSSIAREVMKTEVQLYEECKSLPSLCGSIYPDL